jgi:hypothetical protein
MYRKPLRLTSYTGPNLVVELKLPVMVAKSAFSVVIDSSGRRLVGEGFLDCLTATRVCNKQLQQFPQENLLVKTTFRTTITCKKTK